MPYRGVLDGGDFTTQVAKHTCVQQRGVIVPIRIGSELPKQSNTRVKLVLYYPTYSNKPYYVYP